MSDDRLDCGHPVRQFDLETGGCRACAELQKAIDRDAEREMRVQRLLRRRYQRAKLGAPLLLLAFAAPLAAQPLPAPLPAVGETPEPVEEPAEALPGLYLSAWCAIERGEDDEIAICDQGLAGALKSWDPGEPGDLRLSWVLFGGAETVGTGAAVSRRISERVVLGFGAGVVVPIPEDGGLDFGKARGCVGITASFW